MRHVQVYIGTVVIEGGGYLVGAASLSLPLFSTNQSVEWCLLREGAELFEDIVELAS